MEDPEYRRLGDTQERMIRLARQGDEGWLTIWESLTIREQRMLYASAMALIAQMRVERGDPSDAEYGPA